MTGSQVKMVRRVYSGVRTSEGRDIKRKRRRERVVDGFEGGGWEERKRYGWEEGGRAAWGR